jgi:ABC-type transport system involved in cytochrome c biogenesis permease subunit
MKRTNSLSKVLFYAFLTALFFSITNELAWSFLGGKVVVVLYAIMAVICLILMFTEKGVTR